MFDFDPWLYLRIFPGGIVIPTTTRQPVLAREGMPTPSIPTSNPLSRQQGCTSSRYGFPSGQPIPDGADYQLQVSLDSLLAVQVNNVAPDNR